MASKSIEGEKLNLPDDLPGLPSTRYALYRVAGRSIDDVAGDIETALEDLKQGAVARIERRSATLVIGGFLERDSIEHTVRRFGFSIDADHAAGVARGWLDFLRNDRLGDD